MSRWADSVAVPAVLVVAGVALLSFVSYRASVDEGRRAFGSFAVGEVVEVTDSEVVVTYKREQEDFIAVAYPVTPRQFTPGELVDLQVLPDEPRHAVIRGTEESRTSHVPAIVTGLALGGTGLALLILRALRAGPIRTEGHVSPVKWVGRRHGGA